jgi:hypothetical protein
MGKNIDELLTEWRSWLCGNDVSSIMNQLVHLLRHAAAFQILLDANAQARQRDSFGVLNNTLIQEFALNGYTAYASLAIRRLIDRNVSASPQDPAKRDDSVVSLRRLIVCMKDHREALTRAILIRRRSREDEFNHQYNLLCGFSNSDRTMDSIIPGSVFNAIILAFDRCDATYNVATKRFAHSSSPSSRRQAPSAETATLADLDHAIEIVCSAFSFSKWVLAEQAYPAHYLPDTDYLVCLEQPIIQDDWRTAVSERSRSLARSRQELIENGWQRFNIS